VDLSPAKGLKEPAAAKASRPSLPFREPELSLRDILEGIDMIVTFVQDMDLEAFLKTLRQ
jgi:hypothetical protein